ncbi:MAG: bL17 family ribosomal protein [Tannerella sp.]|nr:bL17 family ribosomal protein [Tannerella sp.]
MGRNFEKVFDEIVAKFRKRSIGYKRIIKLFIPYF